MSFDPIGIGSPNEFAVVAGCVTIDDANVCLKVWRSNLRYLRRLQTALGRYATDGDREAFCGAFPFAYNAIRVAESAAARAASPRRGKDDWPRG